MTFSCAISSAIVVEIAAAEIFLCGIAFARKKASISASPNSGPK
jgi:hypothetical protein